MINKKFKLFSNCFSVKGINRGLIIDVQRKNYYPIPNQVIDLINEYSGKEIYSLFKDFENDKNVLKKYIRFFLSNELVIVSNDIKRYPAISSSFERPYNLDTITLDSSLSTTILQDFLKNQIDNLGVSNLKLICNDFDLPKLTEILKYINKSRIYSVVLYIKHDVGFEKELIKLQKKFARIAEVIFYEVKKNDVQKSKFIYETKALEETLSMKINNQDNFLLNLFNFNEALKYSLAYNRTIYIDSLGNIKRYISDELIFGNVAIDDLNEIVLNPEITDFWEINKDKIKVCQDCEFRYICPDGSIPVKTTENKYYAYSQSCNYNPYTNKWLGS
ncbi:hypothetical protein [Flavobacterium hydatis]|uniref:Grasp-with-spasm system SPASM domain peptide maturase n=1 Tax=Flavobacterium hydatis TaxID=991 RepID=A0A086A005_FLAHY|nr:hypothetical protein [Flavobacterium hydatis]KFF10019.1 hypothetical protein IW20_21290 [Flavobacterium hydatis]OXA93348.1 hypothetical protein B0A62_13980 [Flavobacterium hydatis]